MGLLGPGSLGLGLLDMTLIVVCLLGLAVKVTENGEHHEINLIRYAYLIVCVLSVCGATTD